MLPCLILGDSIADGTAVALRVIAGDRCQVVARDGAGTGRITGANPGGAFGTVVLSSGSNDAAVSGLADRLAALRADVTAQTVLWLLPYNRTAAEVVRMVAAANSDRVLDFGSLPPRDGLHPVSYVPIARAVVPMIAEAVASDKVQKTDPPAGADASGQSRGGDPAAPSWVFGQASTSVLVFK